MLNVKQLIPMAVLGLACSSAAVCQDLPASGSAGQKAAERKTVPMKTFGGLQFWGDLHYFHGWRVQQNVLTSHYRLLDEKDVRHQSGTLQACRDTLDEIRQQKKLPPMKGKAVILVHGIGRSSKSFTKLARALREKGYVVFGFDYPSTRVPITESAEYLAKCVKSLDGIEEVNFIVHSMGGLVVRSMLAKSKDPRIKRMVMLGVPNKGAELADSLSKNVLYKAIYGPAGQQLVTGDKNFIGQLPIPDFEFGVVAGSKGNDKGYNPLIPGDDDGTVALSSTRLSGATDFVTRSVLHSFLMSDKKCVEHAVRFIQSGKFREDGATRPIPRTTD